MTTVAVPAAIRWTTSVSSDEPVDPEPVVQRVAALEIRALRMHRALRVVAASTALPTALVGSAYIRADSALTFTYPSIVVQAIGAVLIVGAFGLGLWATALSRRSWLRRLAAVTVWASCVVLVGLSWSTSGSAVVGLFAGLGLPTVALAFRDLDPVSTSDDS